MASQTLEFNGGIFEMFDSEGVSIGGAIDVIGSISIDITTGQGSANFSSKTPFFGYLWTAHDIVVQMTSEDTMKVSMLFDWGDNTDIVVAVDMGIDFNADGTARFTTLDTDGDNILGYPMDSGPFVGLSAAFSGAGTLVVNSAPVASDDTAYTQEDDSVFIDVLRNDTDVDGDTLAVISATAENGTVTIKDDGVLAYTASQDFNGIDTITYTVDDGNGGTDTATVTVDVLAVNDAPVASNDTANTREDDSVFIDVLSNDTDVDGDTLTVISATAENGTVTIKDDGVLAYMANQDFNGTDTITYAVGDGNGGTDTATVTVDVLAVNDAPVASNDTANTREDGSVFIGVLANDIDVDGDTLTVISATAENGTVTIKDDGVLAYIANQRFDGIDAIIYTISDGNGTTDTAIVKVLVQTAELGIGDRFKGDITSSGDVNWHEVDLVAGEKYIFRLQDANRGGGTLKDAHIELRDKSGEVVVEYDGLFGKYEGLSDAVVGLIAPADGKYYLIVKSKGGEEIGSYSIITRTPDDHSTNRDQATLVDFIANEVPTDTIVITGGIQWSDKGLTGVPQELKDVIPDQDEDWISFALDTETEKNFIKFDLESTSTGEILKDATIEIFDPDNNLVARASGKDLNNGAASITLEVLSTGDYTARIPCFRNNHHFGSKC